MTTLITYRYRAALLRIIALLAAVYLSQGNGSAQPTFAFDQIFEGNPQQRMTAAFDWADYYSSTNDSVSVFFRFNTLLDKAKDRKDKYVMLVAKYSIAFYHIVHFNERSLWEEELTKITAEAEQTDRMLWANLLHRSGRMYYTDLKEYAKGLGLLLQAHETFTGLGYENNIRGANLLYELALVYYQLGNYPKCIDLLTPAQYCADTALPYVNLQVLNTLGLAYRNIQKPDSALLFFNKALTVAQHYHDLVWTGLVWTGIVSINISKYYIDKGEYDKALPYSETSYRHSKMLNVHVLMEDSCEALIVLARIDAHNGNMDRALARLANAEKGLNGTTPTWSNMATYDLKHQLYMSLGELYLQKGDEKKALDRFLKAYQYRDSIELVRKEAQLQKVHTEVVAQQYLSKMTQLRNEKKISLQTRNFSLLVLLLAGIWLLIRYNRQRLASRKDIQLFENRKQLLHLGKLHAEEQLGNYILLLQEKNKKLEEIGAELEKLKKLPGTQANRNVIEGIEKLKHTVIITEDDWLTFRDLFENVHHGFFSRLKQQFPDITQAEMRLMALLKLDISNTDMAGMLGVSLATVHKTAYRFRKKIPSDMNRNLGEIADSI